MGPQVSETERELITYISGLTWIIAKGKILEKEMKRLRFNIDDLMEELRSAGYPNILEVEYAIIESNGNLSVIPRSNKRPLTPEDMGINPQYEGIPYLLVSDGVINADAMQNAGVSVEWLISHINEFDIHSIEDVFVATVDSSGNFFIQKKQTKGEKK